MRHGLAEFGPVARVFDEIQLIDDIHQIVQFRHAPEHAVEAQPQFPGIAAPVAMHQQIGFAQIPVRALGIGAVVAVQRRDGDAGCGRKLPVGRCFGNESSGAGTLPRERGRLRIPARLQADFSGNVRGLRGGGCGGRNGEQQPGGDCATKPHQRTRRSAVCVNSPASRLVRNRKSLHCSTVLAPVRWFTMVCSPARQY